MPRILLLVLATVSLLSRGHAQPITVPIQYNHGRLIFSGRIGERGPFKLLLDSACTIPTLHPEAMDELQLTPSGRVRINGIAGEERAPTYRGVVFDLGEVQYAPRRVACVPSERNQRRRRDGVLDAGFFRQYVIEVRPGEKSVQLYSPTNYTYAGSGNIVPFRFREEIPVVEGAILLAGKEPIRGEFEIDTGCDSGLCVGESFIKKNDLLAAIEGRSSEKFGVGGSVETKMVRVPGLRLGQAEFKEIDADFFLKGSPVDEPLAGHVGMATLGKRKVIFDYSRKRLIIE